MLEEINSTLIANDGTSIYTRAWIPANPQRVLVCVQGLGGHGGYYEELACQLAPAGTALVAPDLRGHGNSDGPRGDINRFDRYLVDVDAAVTWASATWPEAPIFVLGESMGASIAIQYVASISRKIPVAGLALVSPVLSPAISPTLSEVLLSIRSLLLAPTRPSIAVTGREELGCQDQDFNERLRADPLFVRHVSARFLTKLTLWLWQSKRKADQINLPLLVLLGGRDYVARHTGTFAFLRHVPAKERRIVTFPQAYHCLLRDPDTPVVMRVLGSWLRAYDGLYQR